MHRYAGAKLAGAVLGLAGCNLWGPWLGPGDAGGADQLAGSIDYALGKWQSPNGAQSTTTSGGTEITGYGDYNHPVIVVDALARDDETVAQSGNYVWTALVEQSGSGTPTEWGLLVGVAWDGQSSDGFGNETFGTQFNGGNTPWLGSFPANTWNPMPASFSASYAVPPNPQFRLTVEVRTEGIGTTTISGQVEALNLDMAGPGDMSGSVGAVAGTLQGKLAGLRAGFYTYGVGNDMGVASVVLHSLRISPLLGPAASEAGREPTP